MLSLLCVSVHILLISCSMCYLISFPIRDIDNGVHSQQLSNAVPESSKVIGLAASEGPALLKAL